MTNIEALDGICALVMHFEGCFLRAYPDPASPLYKALSKRNVLRKVMQGQVNIPDDLKHLSGKPWTCGFGETEGVTPDTVWSLDEAKAKLRERVSYFMLAVYKKCPQLYLEPIGRIIGCTSLAYNIGVGAFASSSVCSNTKRQEFESAAKAFLLWNKAGGVVMFGLTTRRHLESKRYSSV